MGDKLKSAAGLAFGAAVAIGLLALPFIFIKGAVWASEHLLAPLISVGWYSKPGISTDKKRVRRRSLGQITGWR